MHTPNRFRVGQSTRPLGEPTDAPEGFTVVDLRTDLCYTVESGVWVEGSMPDLIAQVWNQELDPDPDPDPIGDYTFYVDPSAGNDSNAGTSLHPWLTTGQSDGQTLSGVQTVGYKMSGSYVLYRKLNMTANESTMTVNLMTATANQF